MKDQTPNLNKVDLILSTFIDALVNNFEAVSVGEITEAQNEELVDEYQNRTKQALIALFESLAIEVIGVDKNLSIASRGKELDDKTLNSKYFIRESAKNELRAEQRANLQRLRKTDEDS